MLGGSTTSDFTLVQMPAITEEWNKMAAAITIPFRGEPSLPLLSDGSAAAPEGEAEADPDAPPPERFREMHRLAHTVVRMCSVICFSELASV